MPASSTLRQAASAVFALTTVLPLLIFVWTLHSLGALGRPAAQVGLCLALAVALLGFYIFRGLVAQMSSSLVALGSALEKPALRASVQAAAPIPAPATATKTPAPSITADAPPAVMPAKRLEKTQAVPGLGEIAEVQNLNRAMAALWRSEAEAFKGQRVVISIVNAPHPITGTLIMLGHDGLLIQTDQQDHVPVSYSRIETIDAENAPTSSSELA